MFAAGLVAAVLALVAGFQIVVMIHVCGLSLVPVHDLARRQHVRMNCLVGPGHHWRPLPNDVVLGDRR